MEKKLLLLGILRDHEMHGYQLSEMLAQSAGIPIRMSKPNAYKLLNKMEQDGWVTYREEQEGNRPPRRVYRISSKGEIAFQQMLRDSLADYSAPEFPGAVVFNFLELLPAAEAAELLEQRQEKVAAHFTELDQIPVEMRDMHPGIEYLIRFYRWEIEWLEELISELNAK